LTVRTGSTRDWSRVGSCEHAGALEDGVLTEHVPTAAPLREKFADVLATMSVEG
jgi:hypothetical protein